MIDIKFLRENPDIVRENIKKKFQDAKLPLVDEVIELDAEKRATQQKADSLRASRNKLSKQIGALMGQGKKAEAEEVKAQVKAQSDELIAAEAKEKELDEKILKIMMTIPNIIDASVPVGKDDSETSRLSVSASRSFRISRFRTTRRSWKASTVSIWTLHAALRVTASII
jgi:seryl-tRNA synthetase